MKIFAGLLILAVSLQSLLVSAEAAAAAAAAASSSNGGASVATASAVAVSASTSTARIPCNCNRIYQPVCGSDGITYSNECILRCVSANNVKNGRPPICVKKQGVCPQKPCQCSSVYNPICGTDGHTYGNDCLLDCENKRRQLIGLRLIKIDHRGACKYAICTCPDLIIPVCGTDNKTYRNVCVLQCVSRHNQANGKPCIGVQNNGACAKESCMCPANLDLLCASDGKTYSNLCMLQCQNRRRNQLGLSPLSVQYKGKCVDCPCPTIYDPVCASNDVNFANTCTLGCENKKRKEKNLPPLKIKNYGVCPCLCKLIWAPVCGSDKKTYSNKCLLNCENKRRSDLGIPLIWVKNNGRCYCNCDYCPTYYGPICGSDGRTYWNKCFFACHRDCNSNLYMTKQGPC